MDTETAADTDGILAEIEDIATLAVDAIRDAGDPDALEAAKAAVYGRKSRLTEIRRSIGSLPKAAKPAVGAALNKINERIDAAIADRAAVFAAAAEQRLLESEALDLTLPGRRRRMGHRHVITKVFQEIADVFVGMGYRIAEGPEVETAWYSFDALNIPPTHPARLGMDTIYVDHPAGTAAAATEGEVLLRPHTSPVQIRLMETEPPPLYYIVPGRVFRNDTVDATHASQFHQIEGLAIDRDLSFGDLAGTIERFCHEYFGPGFDIRLFPDFFPFTEPSAGLEVRWGESWLEIAGCGMVDPNVLEAVGLDPEQWQGFAWGFGVERIAMLRYGVPDIRWFTDNDVRFLERFT
ncbi:MAG: phenylalanine--tRNA ligase subunit alpha [Acidimicrobiia bacterium]|nr:phenylalanine--tRNA ligase subunit alpha [Acidimicrobiia bacterium]